jgi:hypothetical protein
MSGTETPPRLPSCPSADFISALHILYSAPDFISEGALKAVAISVADAAAEVAESGAESVTLPAWGPHYSEALTADTVAELAAAFAGRAAEWRTMRPDAVADAAAAVIRGIPMR